MAKKIYEKQALILAPFKLPWKSYELEKVGDQTELWEISRFYNMHDEDVIGINYLKLAFLERISVCIKGTLTYQQETQWFYLCMNQNAWTKYFVSYRNFWFRKGQLSLI